MANGPKFTKRLHRQTSEMIKYQQSKHVSTVYMIDSKENSKTNNI